MRREVRSDPASQNIPKEQNIDDVCVLIEGAGDPLQTRIVIARKPEEAARAERQRQMREARKKASSSIRAVYRCGICDVGDVPVGKRLSAKRNPRLVPIALANRTRLQETENSAADPLPAGENQKGGRSWIYAHLILAIATDACSQDFLGSPPDEMIDADYAPSIWRVQKTVIMVLRIAILGASP